MEGHYPLYCDDCLVPMTVEHVVTKCPNYYRERARYFGTGNTDDFKTILTGCNASFQSNLNRFLEMLVSIAQYYEVSEFQFDLNRSCARRAVHLYALVQSISGSVRGFLLDHFIS